jgi:hypothetical protein
MSILFAYAMIRFSHERWQRRARGLRDDAVKFWKEIGGGIIWIAGLLATLAIYIQEYHDKLTRPY